MPCLYSVLGLTPEATPGEVRTAYRALARQHHPDKQKRKARQAAGSEHAREQNDEVQRENTAPANAAAETGEASGAGLGKSKDNGKDKDKAVPVEEEFFTVVARAYEVLSDPTKREMYNQIQGHDSSMDKAKYASLAELKRQDALRDVDMMRVTYDIKRRTELAKGGLVIDAAVYGARDVIEINRLEDLTSCSFVQDVTRQLQCVVEKSKLILASGEPKHRMVTGLYDVAPAEPKLLSIRYWFRGRLHQVIVEDEQRLLMPLKSHQSKRLPRVKARRKPAAGSATAAVPRSRALSGLWVAGLCAASILVGVGAVAATPALRSAVLDSRPSRAFATHWRWTKD